MTLRKGRNGWAIKAISGFCLRGLICSYLLCALTLGHCPSSLCKIWGMVIFIEILWKILRYIRSDISYVGQGSIPS